MAVETTLLSPVTKSFLAGFFSGTCSTIIFQPLDLVKTRMQTSIAAGGPTGMVMVMNNVVQQDKVYGLWRGLVPSLSRSGPGIAMYFSSVHFLRTKFGSDKPKPAESFVTGAVARSMSGIMVIPFTVLKTRYESGVFTYENGLRRAISATYRAEGMRSLTSGLAPTLMRDVPFSSLYLMFYTQLKQRVGEADIPSAYVPIANFLCGVNSGILAAVITQPSDVVKTHMQMNPKLHRTLMLTVKYIYEKDGINGFMRGILPRTIRRTLMAAVAWTIYDTVSQKCGLK